MAAMVENAEGYPADGAPREASGVSAYEVPESDWRIWRELRLDALADAPYAFTEPLDRARAKTEADWRSWWSDAVRCGPRFIGLFDGAPVGMCAVCFPEDFGGAPLLINMWTSPKARGRGLGRAMLDACVEYCEQAGHPRFLLGVVEDNLPARRLYESYGFVETGDSEPLDSDASKRVLWMAKQIVADHA
jgi:ribosomal protein S18 acetylase RimI-like enzyme